MSERQFDASTHYTDPAIAAGYDQARFTTLLGRFGHWKEMTALGRVLDAIPDVQTALDVPCGTGRITRTLLERGLDVTGADISPQMMAEAKKKCLDFGSRVRFIEANLRNLSLDRDSFDVVTCVRFFGHVDSDARVEILRQMHRVTRRWVVVNYYYLTALILAKRWIKRNVLHTYEGVIHPCTKETMMREIAAAGLKVHRLSFAQRYYSEEVFALLSKDA